MSGPPLRTVLFDLDGTLLDTAQDLAFALNQVLVGSGRRPMQLPAIRPHVSHGARALIRVGFGLEPEDEGYETVRRELLAIYRDNIARHTRLFPGMESVLERIDELGLNWGVVTNKPAWLTDPLVSALGLHTRAACVVSGDTTTNSKPHPEPMLLASRLAGSRPEECIYVGDASRDVEAGRRAGMRTLVALFGYIAPDETPERWPADGHLHTPRDLIPWLESLSGPSAGGKGRAGP